MYSCYTISKESKALLIDTFPILYNKFIGHHITEEFGEEATLPSPRGCVVYGYIDNRDGLEALLVTVNERKLRPDGNYYHITWSLDSSKHKPVDSCVIIRNATTFMPCFPIVLETQPALL